MAITILFFLLFGVLTVYLTRRTVPALSIWEAALAFGWKALLACFYGYLFIHYYGGDDTWDVHIGSINECALLKTDPVQFFLDFLPIKAWRISGGDISQALAYYLDKLEWHLQVKTLGIFNLVSGGNYYANAIYYSFLTFWGHFLLFKLTVQLFPARRLWLFLLIFFFPPVVFWLTGIRADGFLFLCVSFFLIHAYRWIHDHRRRSLWWALLGLAGVFIFRNVLVLIMLPAVVAWFIAVRYDRKPGVVFGAAFGIATFLFLVSGFLPGPFNLAALVADRQAEFMTLHGNTRFGLTPLSPDAGSFLKVLPEAFLNAFVRPFLWEARGPLQIMAAVEVLFFWTLLIMTLLRRNTAGLRGSAQAWIWFMVFFSIANYLFIGLVVPFPGAIVRYKAIPELLLLVTMVLAGRPGPIKQGWRRPGGH
ncbi:hypothetical protein [Paraflavitalea sp. CAU 1676]|uniref:hypothetical protein n=1 Tax=Paraflavitalea sp. CAU 1676 TaxID=3032598 RepID=UPI0023DC3D6D|nr:hypothetical protein [Paraflavitalea sp. CAU 1676]MDF2191702.1 hypothetical protein [Paraflavitalea sp. CAU 1676]